MAPSRNRSAGAEPDAGWALKGRLLGAVYFDSRVVRDTFTDEDVDLLVALTHQVAT